jgi:hypothetical protein
MTRRASCHPKIQALRASRPLHRVPLRRAPAASITGSRSNLKKLFKKLIERIDPSKPVQALKCRFSSFKGKLPKSNKIDIFVFKLNLM